MLFLQSLDIKLNTQGTSITTDKKDINSFNKITTPRSSIKIDISQTSNSFTSRNNDNKKTVLDVSKESKDSINSSYLESKKLVFNRETKELNCENTIDIREAKFLIKNLKDTNTKVDGIFRSLLNTQYCIISKTKYF